MPELMSNNEKLSQTANTAESNTADKSTNTDNTEQIETATQTAMTQAEYDATLQDLEFHATEFKRLLGKLTNPTNE